MRKVIAMGIWTAIQFLGADAQAGARFEPDTLLFGPVRVGRGAVDTVRLRNPEAVDLLLESRSLSGPAYSLAGAPFSGAPVRLAPGEALEVLVRFAPPDTGAFSGRLDVETDAGSVGLRLEGEGAAEVVAIDEVLADPASGEAGDANGDGTRHSSQDEFVELLNTGLRPVALGGWQLADAGTAEGSRFTFPEGTWIGPGERVVLFGGGAPAGGIEGQVFVDDGKIGKGLSNSGDAVYLIDPAGPDTVARAEYGPEGGKDESLVRQPEGRGGFVRHGRFPGKGTRFSPGRARVVASRVEVAPADTSVELGAALAFRARAVFTDGSDAYLGAELNWAVSDPQVLELEEGSGRAVGVGQADVTAEAGGIVSAPARVTVSAPGVVDLLLAPGDTLLLVGEAVVYTVQGIFPDGSRERIDGGLSWTASDTLVVRFTGENGALALGPGRATVAAGLEGLQGTALFRAAEMGDLNADGSLDVVDALRTVHLILEMPPPAGPFESRASDLNGDGGVDVLDLAALIGKILGGPVGGMKAARPGVARWWMDGTILKLKAPAALSALFVEVQGPVDGVTLRASEGARSLFNHTSAGRGKAAIFSLDPGGLPAGTLDITLRVAAGGAAGQVRVVEIAGADLRGEPVAFREGRPQAGFGLRNHPNPFNAATALVYELPEDGYALLRIFSATGQEVARPVDGATPAGIHRAVWNGRDRSGREAATGVYIGLLEAGGRRAAVKMVLLK